MANSTKELSLNFYVMELISQRMVSTPKGVEARYITCIQMTNLKNLIALKLKEHLQIIANYFKVY